MVKIFRLILGLGFDLSYLDNNHNLKLFEKAMAAKLLCPSVYFPLYSFSSILIGCALVFFQDFVGKNKQAA